MSSSSPPKAKAAPRWETGCTTCIPVGSNHIYVVTARESNPQNLPTMIDNWIKKKLLPCEDCMFAMKGLYLTNRDSHEWFCVLAHHWSMTEAQMMMGRCLLDVILGCPPDMEYISSQGMRYRHMLSEHAGEVGAFISMRGFIYLACVVARRVLAFDITAPRGLGYIPENMGFAKACEEMKTPTVEEETTPETQR